MNGRRSLFRLLQVVLGMAALVAGFGCEKAEEALLPNRLPEVRLTSAPIDTTGRYYYSITLNWVGFDPDGRVNHYLYAVDPDSGSSGDTTWQQTPGNEVRLQFQSTKPVREQPGGRLLGADFHKFVIRAVDNKGDIGPVAVRAFNSYTIAPEVALVAPRASSFPIIVTPSVRISWRGNDPDGVFTQKPVQYKYILLTSSTVFPWDLAYREPDSLRRYYENHPDGPWAGWDSTCVTVPCDTAQARYTSLTPGSDVVFAVIAFDEAGAYSPSFSFAQNMTRLKIGFAGQYGPEICMSGESFDYCYPSGGYCTEERCHVEVEVAAKRRVTIRWFATPPTGADIESYRWSLDNQDLFDYTMRTNESTDLAHWSSPSASVTQATVGPFPGGEVHFFYIEAEDNNGLKSLGTVRLETVEPSFNRPLLVVDDTRLKSVQYRTQRDSCPLSPSGPWPNRAEMDTFMFARGDKPWRCMGGRISNQGLFGAYDLDTLGTRTGKTDLTVKLSVLGRYRHVVWMTDQTGATLLKSGQDPVDPQVALRYMGARGRVNTIATYIRQGGKVWMNGGGAAYAVTDPWNNRANDDQTRTYSTVTASNELGPGRYMFDMAKWQSTFRTHRPEARIERALGRFTGTAGYAGLPPVIENKTTSSDPASKWAPNRVSIVANTVGIEFIDTDPNFIIEDVNPDPDVTEEQSTLDTLYRVSANNLQDVPPPGSPPDYLQRRPKYVIMTHYNGAPPDSANVIHTGFPLWWPKYDHSKQLVDYVLQQEWGLLPQTWPGNPPRVAHPTLASSPAPQPARPVHLGASRPAPGRGSAIPLPPASRRNARD